MGKWSIAVESFSGEEKHNVRRRLWLTVLYFSDLLRYTRSSFYLFK